MKKPRSANEMAKTIRHVWEINPVTRIVKDKKKYTRKRKHKNKEEEIWVLKIKHPEKLDSMPFYLCLGFLLWFLYLHLFIVYIG